MSRLASLFIGKEKETPLKEGIPENAAPSKYTILFVDDEPNVLKSMRRIFRQENYNLLTASSGDEALAVFARESVQVIITDHQMPGMTGAELLRKIKADYPRTIRIMLTGHADVDAIMGAVNEGAVYKFITKPWNDDDLRITVSLALEQYDLIKENISLKQQQQKQQKEIKQLQRFVNTHRSQVGRILLRNKIIQEQDLRKAELIQTKTNKMLPLILIESGMIEDEEMVKVIQKELGLNRVDPNEFEIPKAIVGLVPREICSKNLLIPINRAEGRLIVAMVDPTDYMKVDDLTFITGIPVEPMLASQKDIRKKLEEIYGDQALLDEVLSEADLADPTETIEIILEEEDESVDVEDLLRAKDQPPAIRIVNAIISDAFRHGASDVHIEPKTKYMVVRYRMDGLLYEKLHIPLAMHPAIVSRIKVMAELDITERRKPQDGRVTVKSSSKMVDMRISTLPTINGEKVVLRLLDRNASIRDIEEVGFSGDVMAKIMRFTLQPQGMLLTTGPTGSGKTSTLYALLQRAATITKNFTTIEDPVEYFMSMAEQVMVREKIGLNFPLVLRSLLRQDPDVIMLGEIRDLETAEVAFHAALTGHLVFSTLHTNSSIASITRLRDIGIQPYVISDALIGVIAQRLIRRICPHCQTETDAPEELLHALGLSADRLDFTPFYGRGCDRCNQTGYSGRIGIFEVLSVDGHLKELIHRDASEMELQRAARLSGMHTLFEDAMTKVRSGMTTLEEVVRVLGAKSGLDNSCPHCHVFLEERFDFCPFCGGTIIRRCRECSQYLDLSWKVCPHCGKADDAKGQHP
ncbi:MAG: ATPase, T2SS/T4P/T4SS family [Pseudomonadota bacterium]